MRSPLICGVCGIALVFTLSAMAQEPTVPKAFPPNIWLASAVKKGPTVAVKVRQLEPTTVLAEKDGEKLPQSVMLWGKAKDFELGKTVQAVRKDGKAASADEVLKALAKPIGVVCFIRGPENRAMPDAFYLNVLRQGSVVLVFEHKDVFGDENLLN